MNYKPGLSIVIPTYNRENQLYNQLKAIFKNDISLITEIVVLDNNSNYNILTLIQKFNTNKIRIVKHPFNIGGNPNIANTFYYCKTEWLWMLSDDDEVMEDSVQKIWEEIKICQEDTGLIKFARTGSPQKKATVKNLEEYIDYYYDEKNIRRGDLVFISTNVYNLNNLKDFLGLAVEYSYTCLSQLIPVFMGLRERRISVTFSSRSIVTFIPPREGWYSFGRIGKAMSTLSHLPLNLTPKYQKKFLNCTMSITANTLMVEYLKNGKIDNLSDFKVIYNNIYRYYLPFKSKIIVKLFLSIMSVDIVKTYSIVVLKILKKI